MQSMETLAAEGLALMRSVCRRCGGVFDTVDMHKIQPTDLFYVCNLCIDIDREDEHWSYGF